MSLLNFLIVIASSSEETAKSLGNETAADYMLQGSIKTIVDTDGQTMTRTYYVTTEMIHIENNKKTLLLT